MPTAFGYKLVLIPLVTPLVPWAHHLFTAAGGPAGQPVPPLAEFLWFTLAFFGVVGLSAFRWRRRNSWCFWKHLTRARRARDVQGPQVRSFLDGGGEAGAALVGYRFWPGQPGFAWLPLCVFAGLLMVVALAALTATGEGALILSFLVAYGLLHPFMLLSGRFHCALVFCGLTGLLFVGGALIVYADALRPRLGDRSRRQSSTAVMTSGAGAGILRESNHSGDGLQTRKRGPDATWLRSIVEEFPAVPDARRPEPGPRAMGRGGDDSDVGRLRERRAGDPSLDAGRRCALGRSGYGRYLWVLGGVG